MRTPPSDLLRSLLWRSRAFVRERLGPFRLLVVVKTLQWPIRSLTGGIARRVRRDPGLVAFGCEGGRFAGNSAYLFLHMSRHADVRCVWISTSRATVDHVRSHGLAAEPRWSLAGIRCAARAAWYVVSHNPSDINVWLSDGAVTFDLWHGVGVKKIRRDMVGHWSHRVFASAPGSFTARIFADLLRPPDWLLSTSPAMTRVFSGAFGVPVERVVELGYPRNDHFLESSEPPCELVNRELYQRIRHSRPIIGYFPTFRDNAMSIPGGAPVVTQMAAIVAERGGTLLFKAHDASIVDVGDATSGLIVLPREADLNAYLGLCDVLVTDFSSVASDFLVLRRPIVLFLPDLETFLDARGFYFDPVEMAPGLLTTATEQLYDALRRFDELPVSERTEALIEHYWGDTASAGASRRVAAFIQSRLVESTGSKRRSASDHSAPLLES